MEKVVDNGKRTQFNSGAVREIDETKGRCDLVYNTFMSKVMSDSFFETIEHVIRECSKKHLLICAKMVVERFYDGNYIEAYLDLSRHYAAGAKKYADRNMEKGLPFHSMIDSALRHYCKAVRGDDDENHKAACLWNLTTLAYMIDYKPEMNDLPITQKT